jgi:hypothetical protein
MNDCLKDQKETEKALHLAEILLTDKSIQDLQGSLKEYVIGLEQTEHAKSALLADLKKHEIESRKLANQEDDLQRKFKSKRDQLIEF